MSPGWVRTQVRTHSDFCWTRGLRLGLWPTGLGLGLGRLSNGLGLGLGLWSNGLGLTPDGLGFWPHGLGLGLGLWPCGLGLSAGLTPTLLITDARCFSWAGFSQVYLCIFVRVLIQPEKLNIRVSNLNTIILWILVCIQGLTQGAFEGLLGPGILRPWN